MELKLVIADPKQGKCKQVELKDELAVPLKGKKIGDTIKGDNLGFQGYEFLITGGSDNCGFPMRKDISGLRRKKILAVSGVGIRKKGKGIRQRKTVAPRTITDDTAQVNVKIIKYGKESIFEEKASEETSSEKSGPNTTDKDAGQEKNEQ